MTTEGIISAVLGTIGLATIVAAGRLHFDHLQMEVVRIRRRLAFAAALAVVGATILGWGVHVEDVASGTGMFPFVMGGAGAMSALLFILVTWMTASEKAYVERRRKARENRMERPCR